MINKNEFFLNWKRYYGFYLIVLVSFLSACISELNDDAIDLGNGYTYVREGQDLKYIRPNTILSDNIIYPKVEDYAFDDKFILALQKPHLNHYVSLLASDLSSRYYLLKNHNKTDTLVTEAFSNQIKIISDSTIVKLFDGRVSINNSGDDIVQSRLIVDSLIKVTPYFKNIFSRKLNYWIISKPMDKIYGPYSSKEYALKRKELLIPETLKLK